MNYLVTLLSLVFFMTSFNAQTPTYVSQDSNGDGHISISDLLSLLVIFGESDSDLDGVWDTFDLCVDISACNYLDNPTNICYYLDNMGVCGSVCLNDVDGDGICDEFDTCFGVIDVCGVCGGMGATVQIINSITTHYDSVYAVAIDQWFVFEVGLDTTYTYECPPTYGFLNCGDFIVFQGYTYPTVSIGGQCWFSENCRYLPAVYPSAVGSTVDPCYYVFGYQGNNVDSAMVTVNYNTFGALYNYAAITSTDLCPVGWHIPSDLDWQTLEISLGMSSVEASNTGWRGSDQGSQMKATSGWDNNGNGSNSCGFTALPGGYRSISGAFSPSPSSYGFWWCSSSQVGSNAWYRRLFDSNEVVHRTDFNKLYGFSARCLLD